MQVEEWEGFAMLGGNCNCKSQVSLRAPSSSDPRVSPPTNILSLFPSCSESLDNHRRQSLPVVKSHRDLRMPALQLFGFNLTDSMTASPHSLTSVKQAENCLHSRGHCKSRRQTEKSCRLVGRNPCERVTTAVYGLADGWELTGSVEG